MSNEEIIKYMKQKKNYNVNNIKSNYISNLFTRTLISIILVLLIAIVIKNKPDVVNIFKERIFDKSLSFNKISNVYNKYFGKVIPIEIDKGTTKMVFNDKIDYTNIENYENGFRLTLNNKLVTSLYDGIVVFIGEKPGYGNTVIVQGSDGVDIWYGNVENISVKLYDYINKSNTIGEAKDNNLFLLFNKENEYLNYEEYLK